MLKGGIMMTTNSDNTMLEQIREEVCSKLNYLASIEAKKRLEEYFYSLIESLEKEASNDSTDESKE